MIRDRPRTLFGRLVLILVSSLLLAQALTFAFVLAERSLAMRGMMVSYLAADVASSVAMLDRLPRAERAGWLPRLQRTNYNLRLGVEAGAPSNAGSNVGTTSLRESELARSVTQTLSKALSQPVTAVAPEEAGVELRLVLRLQDGTPVIVDLAQPRLRLSPWLLAALTAQLLLLAGGCWLAIRQVTRPLARLAEAAGALVPGRPGMPLDPTGPREVARAAEAFNRMRQRIDEHLEERSQMLGAISHDLQTPITRMRLRTELLDDETLRDKLHADLGQMQHLVEQGLAYARTAQAEQEPEASTEIVALLQSCVADACDAGQAVAWRGGAPAALSTRPPALRRIVGNLVDNAIKFAGAAEVELVKQDGCHAILVMDRGPGIAPQEREKVMQPFYRIEGSRNPATGGTGLGLAIVQRLAHVCNAEFSLLPREGGGLTACVRFRSPVP